SHYSDGAGVLARCAAHSRPTRSCRGLRCARSCAAPAVCVLVHWHGRPDCAGHAASLDHAPAALAALVSGVVHQWRAQPGRAAALALPRISVGGLRICRASLFVYWLHIEFVYGRFSILPKRSQSILSATTGIVIIFAAMVAVAAIRNRAKGRGVRALAFWRRPAGVTA